MIAATSGSITIIGQRRQRAQANGHVAAGHDQIAVREIHRARRVDDEYKAECHKGVGRSERDAIDRKLNERHRRRACVSYLRISCSPA